MFDRFEAIPVGICLLVEPQKPLTGLISHIAAGVLTVPIAAAPAVTDVYSDELFSPLVICIRMVRVRVEIQPALEPSSHPGARETRVPEALELVFAPGIRVLTPSAQMVEDDIGVELEAVGVQDSDHSQEPILVAEPCPS